MENKKVLTELKDGVLIVTINRNERRNAIDPETSAMMEEVLNNAEKDSEVGCIIITGAGEKRSEEHTSELQSPSIISYAVFCLKKIFF